MADISWLGSFGFLGGSRAGIDPDVQAYASRSGMESGKVNQLNDLVLYLKQQGFWNNIKHMYLMAKGFNAGSGATIYDLIANGESMSHVNCNWPTSEGQAISIPGTGYMTSTTALIPTTGNNTVIISLRYPKFIASTSQSVWYQGDSPLYALVFNYNATLVSQIFYFIAGDGVNRNMTANYRTGGGFGNWSDAYFSQAYWKHEPIAVVLDQTNDRGYAYMNRDLCSALATSEGGNNGVAIASPVINNTVFKISAGLNRITFDVEYLLILDTTITGTQYQNITYQFDRALAPRSPSNINSGLIWIDASGNDIAQSCPSMFYDSVTDKYYRYAIPGSLYNGTPPLDVDQGTYQGVYAYSSSSMAGPWTAHGLAYDQSNATLQAALSNPGTEDTIVFTATVIYHTTRGKYVMGMKAYAMNEDGTVAVNRFVLAESDSPAGSFTTTYAGQVNGGQCHDCYLFKDNDGTAYLVFHNGSKLQICALTADYDEPTGTPQDITTSNYEAPGMVRVGDRYWVICSESAVYTPTQHHVFYSDAANPLSGWTDAGNPFDSGNDAYLQAFMSQSLCGLFKSRNGDVIYNGVWNVPMYYAPFDRRAVANRPVMLPVTISGTAMTISWDAHWSPSGYE